MSKHKKDLERIEDRLIRVETRLVLLIKALGFADQLKVLPEREDNGKR